MEETTTRRSRPVRRIFGGIAALVAAADVAVATALPENAYRIPTVPAASRMPMLAYGGFLLLVAVWAVATSFAKGSAARAIDSDTNDYCPTDEDARRVIHALRADGWYIADNVALPGVDVDHVAVGPAGVLAVQIMWTNRPDDRAKPAVRARIAAKQLHRVLAAREHPVDVVPAVLAFGPGMTQEPGGVKVVDSVAILFGDQADQWMGELGRRRLLPESTVDAVRSIVGDLREGTLETTVEAPIVLPEPVLV